MTSNTKTGLHDRAACTARTGSECTYWDAGHPAHPDYTGPAEPARIQVWELGWSEVVSYTSRVAVDTEAMRAVGMDPGNVEHVLDWIRGYGQAQESPVWFDWVEVRGADQEETGCSDWEIDGARPAGPEWQYAAQNRLAAQLGRYHGREALFPFGDPDGGEFDEAALMTALGETGETTAENHAHRFALCETYAAERRNPWA